MNIKAYKNDIVKTEGAVFSKRKNKNIVGRLLTGTYGGIFYKTINPETGKKFNDFTKVSKKQYNQIMIGDISSLFAYRGTKYPDKIHLMRERAISDMYDNKSSLILEIFKNKVFLVFG